LENKNHIEEIIELIQEKYGSLECPDFSFVSDAISNSPYEELIQQVKENFQTQEDTDPNDDVSFGYLLIKGDKRWILRLSMLGKYAILLRLNEGGDTEILSYQSPKNYDLEKNLITILINHKIELISRETALYPVELRLSNAELGNTRVYQALFTDTEIIPGAE
jgi:hypothetical protein